MDFKKKRLIILVAQIVVTLILGFSVFSYTNSQLDLQEVYVYSHTIDDQSQALTKADIKKVEIPARAVMDGFQLDPEEIIGKHIDRKVDQGSYIYESQLVDSDSVDVFSEIDLTNKRKISLPISYVEGFAGNIKKGEKVDLAYVGAGQTDESDFNYSKVFLQDIPVWSVNTGDGYIHNDLSNLTPDSTSEQEGIQDQMNTGELEIITLAVDLDQAEEIIARKSAGRIEFIGRFSESENTGSLGFVLGDYEKIFSGKGNAETGRTIIESDGFDDMINTER